MSGKKYYGYQGHAGRRGGGNSQDGLFGWTVFILMLIGLVFLCWMGSYYIFARPETASNYRLLQRLHKLEAPQRFEITEAPRGEFLKPGQLLERFGSMTPGEIRRSNETLLRGFIRNYHQSRDLIPYAVGTYRILGTLPLSSQTFCKSGVVAILQAVEQPEILLEQIFTANEKNLPALQAALVRGQEIKLEKPLDLSAVVHIDRLPDNRIRLTTMPLLYGSYGSGQGPASFSLEPPDVLNLEAGLPVVKAEEIDQLAGGASSNGKGDKKSHLKRIAEETATPTPEPRIAKAIPVQQSASSSAPSFSADTNEPPIARALPVNTTAILPAIAVGTPLPTPIPVATALSTPVATPIPTPFPTPVPVPVVVATPKPTPASVATAKLTPSSIPAPTPFSATNPTLAIATNAALVNPSQPWPVYAPGQMPRGALLDPQESESLAKTGTGNERHYLRGRFSVTASGNGKVVLRPQSALAGLPIGQSSRIRVIVEFPAGVHLPEEGNTVARDALRPFQITAVKHGDDGVINVYAREVTRGE